MEKSAATNREVSIDYLRAFITLLVLAHHSSLAYTTFAHVDVADPTRSTAPIVDVRRWAFLDYAENFNDVFFMSLMFLISGLFVWPILKRKGVLAFLKDRLVRLGVPFAVGVIFLMPLAYYPAWLASGQETGYLWFWFGFIATVWAPGPLWFIWVLLLFDALAAVVFTFVGKKDTASVAKSASKTFILLFILSFFAYVPMLSKFGFGTWVPFITRPFYFQLPRIFLYLTWFFAGVVIGRNGLARGFLSEESGFARHWPVWVLFAFAAYNGLWFIPRMVTGSYGAVKIRDLVEVALWVLSCTASSFAFLSLFRGKLRKRSPWMDSISRCAYLMYVLHYVFVIWIQFALLNVQVNAIVKFSVTFVGTLAASWGCSFALLRIRAIRSIA